MTDLVASDEVFLSDLEGLLSLDGSFTPRLSTPRPVEGSNALGVSIFTQVVDVASPSSSSDTSSKIDKRTNRREKEKNRQRRYRQRLKDSRQELQRQVDELSEHLSELRQKASKRTKTNTVDDVIVRSQWMTLVDEQRQRRLQAEGEKKRLITAVNIQADYINELRQVVTKRNKDGMLACQRNAPTLHSMTSVLYMTYLQQLEGCYARFDNVMEMCGLVSMPESALNSVHRRKSDGGVAYFHHVNKLTLPYSYRQTCQALWKLIHEQDEPAFGGDEMAPDDDVFIKTRVLKSANTGALAQRFVSRQYKEEKRMLFVWKVSSEGEDGFRGLHAEETGWICVEPSETGVMMSVCVQQVPMRFSSARDHEPAIGKFYNLLHDSLEADKQEMTERMGRALLDEVLNGIEC